MNNNKIITVSKSKSNCQNRNRLTFPAISRQREDQKASNLESKQIKQLRTIQNF